MADFSVTPFLILSLSWKTNPWTVYFVVMRQREVYFHFYSIVANYQAVVGCSPAAHTYDETIYFLQVMSEMDSSGLVTYSSAALISHSTWLNLSLNSHSSSCLYFLVESYVHPLLHLLNPFLTFLEIAVFTLGTPFFLKKSLLSSSRLKDSKNSRTAVNSCSIPCSLV